MKSLLLSVLAISAASSALAASGADHLLSNADKREIRQLVPGADLDNLTPAQAGAVSAALYSSDRASPVGPTIRAILK